MVGLLLGLTSNWEKKSSLKVSERVLDKVMYNRCVLQFEQFTTVTEGIHINVCTGNLINDFVTILSSSEAEAFMISSRCMEDLNERPLNGLQEDCYTVWMVTKTESPHVHCGAHCSSSS